MLLTNAFDDMMLFYNSKVPEYEDKLAPSQNYFATQVLDAALNTYRDFNENYNFAIASTSYLEDALTVLNIRYAPRVVLFGLLNKGDSENPLKNWDKIDRYVIKNKVKGNKQTEYSGEFFFKTSQTIDLMNQLLEMCKSDDLKNDENYLVLASKLENAISLIQKSPIPIYKNSSN